MQLDKKTRRRIRDVKAKRVAKAATPRKVRRWLFLAGAATPQSAIDNQQSKMTAQKTAQKTAQTIADC